MNSSKRQQSPQEETPSKKAKGQFNPRDEAAAPLRNPPFKTKTTLSPRKEDNRSDSDSEPRDRAYQESEQNIEKEKELNIEFELALDEDNIKEALALATTDEQRERAKKAAEYIEQVGKENTQIKTFKEHKLRRPDLTLQVKRRKNILTDPRLRKTPSFFAAEKAADSYNSQVSVLSSQYKVKHLCKNKNNISFLIPSADAASSENC